MSGFYTVAVTICAAALACSILSVFVDDSGLKRVLSLVMGAFMVCSLLIPAKNAIGEISLDLSSYPSAQELISTSDEAINRQVVAQTRENLENTLRDLLAQNGIEINSCKIVLSDQGQNRIIISSIVIYIDMETAVQSTQISSLCSQNFGIEPNIITERS